MKQTLDISIMTIINPNSHNSETTPTQNPLQQTILRITELHFQAHLGVIKKHRVHSKIEIL